jgi:hypothetical protein
MPDQVYGPEILGRWRLRPKTSDRLIAEITTIQVVECVTNITLLTIPRMLGSIRLTGKIIPRIIEAKFIAVIGFADREEAP